MHTSYDGIPIGQAEEGIEKVEWKNPEQIKEALKIPMKTLNCCLNQIFKSVIFFLQVTSLQFFIFFPYNNPVEL